MEHLDPYILKDLPIRIDMKKTKKPYMIIFENKPRYIGMWYSIKKLNMFLKKKLGEFNYPIRPATKEEMNKILKQSQEEKENENENNKRSSPRRRHKKN